MSDPVEIDDQNNSQTGQVYHQAARFLTLLDPQATSFTFQTFDDDKERAEDYKAKNSGYSDPRITKVLHGTLAEHWDTLVEINNSGAGVFVTVNETDGFGRLNENIVRIRALFIDLDGAPLEPVLGSRLKAHLVVESSEGKWHTYWLIKGLHKDTDPTLDVDDDLARKEFSEIQEALAERFDGDPKVSDLPRVMRLPGFYHRKAEPFLVRIQSVADDCTPYPAEHFRLPPRAPERPRGSGDDLTSDALRNLAAWVPALFGDKARPNRRGGYRVTSRNLGRRLIEDLSLHPDGIKDFGVHDMGDEREGKRTPTDVVLEWGPQFGVDVRSRYSAESWLAEKLGRPKPKIITATPFVWVEPSTIPRRQWLYRPHYVRQFVGTTISTGGTGKSSLVIVEALSMVSGKALLGVLPEQPLRVWYWNGEDPADELQRRVVAAMKHHRLTGDDIGGRLFVDSGRTMPIVIAEDTRTGTRVAAPVVEQVIATLLENRIDVLIIDPFVSRHRVNENDNSGIERVAKCWSNIAEQVNCSVMLVHHSRKTNAGGVSVDDSRGASALLAAARSARALNTMTVKEAELAEIEERQRRRFFRADLGKTNLTRPPEQADWFLIASVDLGNGVVFEAEEVQQFSGMFGDEVGVVTSWSYPKLDRPAVAVEDVIRVREIIEDRGPFRLDARSRNESWIGVPIAEVLGMDLTREPHRKATAERIAEWLSEGWLSKVDRLGPDRKTHSYVTVGPVEPGSS